MAQVNVIQVATVSPKLDLFVLEKILGGIEARLRQMGATRIWLDRDDDLLAVVAELPARRASHSAVNLELASGPC